MSKRDIQVVIPMGCACQGVTMGGYENQVELQTPAHMLEIGNIGCLTFRETTCVDRCVANLVQALWERGVITTGACCGHNIRDGYIGIYEIGENDHDQ
jgi:predicted transcriptional regulator